MKIIIKKIISFIGISVIFLIVYFLFTDVINYMIQNHTNESRDCLPDMNTYDLSLLEHGDINFLILWIIHLFLTAIPFILYFIKFQYYKYIADYLILPIYNIDRLKILSTIISLLYIILVFVYYGAFWYLLTIDDYTPESEEESLWDGIIVLATFFWPVFIISLLLHEILYIVSMFKKQKKL